MRIFLIACSTVAVLAGLNEDKLAWVEWQETHEKSYSSVEEEADRFNIFRNNLRYYERKTANDTAVYGVDPWSDLTMEEFLAQQAGCAKMPGDCLQSAPMDPEEVASILREHGSEINWVEKGAVTAVKNQGQYGSCWSFGASGIMEGINVVQGKNKLESVSEQELIDCSSCGGYVGCCLTKYYVAETNGIATSEQSYPYKGRSSSCQRSKATKTKAHVSTRLCPANGAGGDQEGLVAQLIKLGPFGYLLDASCLSGYHSGVISNCPKKAGDIDHATLAVGAGTEGGVDYFLVKNSWGTSFGLKGYYKMKRGTNPPQGGVPGGVFGTF